MLIHLLPLQNAGRPAFVSDALIVLGKPANNMIDIMKVCASSIIHDTNTNMVSFKVFDSTDAGRTLKTLIESECNMKLYKFVNPYSMSDNNYYIELGHTNVL